MNFFSDFDISDSIFINEPTDILKTILAQYDFRDVSSRKQKQLFNIFSASNIIKRSHINNEFYILMPKMRHSQLLYRYTNDGASPEIFHKLCDNKGPTLTIVRANGGYIFGAFSPVSWIPEYAYVESQDAFIFSIKAADTAKDADRKPFKCIVKRSKMELAIK